MAKCLLVEMGERLHSQPAQVVQFTGNAGWNALLNDLERHPHAYVLACLMDKQITAERAWAIPPLVREELGTFEIDGLGRLSQDEWAEIFARRNLHRFNGVMADVFFRAIQNIINKYGSDASRIWSGTPSSATVVLRFLSFRGAGPKIATMAANILVRDFKVPFSDHHSIDVSPDVHVRRVLTRTGHIPAQASHEQIIYKARELSPQFPGVIDLACWTIGRKHCHAQAPSCKECPVRAECVTAGGSACPSPHP